MKIEKLLRVEEWTRRDGAHMKVEVVKIEKGIRQRMYVDGVRVMDTFSERPYKLGQACDGTIDICVHALYISYCRAKGLDPETIFTSAYKNEKYPPDLVERTFKEAQREGVLYPKVWGTKEFEGLIESLTEINHHSLVGVLEEIAHDHDIKLYDKI
jgi:hypothetical protein